MNIQQAKKEIKDTLRMYLAKDESGCYLYPAVRQRPILLIGASGIGKTAILGQAAQECGVGLVAYTMTHHTRQSAVGLPKIVHENFDGLETDTTVYTMSEIIASIYRSMKQTGKREGILFLDEINCVSETLTPVILQLLQNKMFGTAHVPEGWMIVAAGNPPQYNRSAREFDIVTLDRVRQITVDPDADVWLSYAASQGVHGAILSFLKMKPDRFYKAENTEEGRKFVTARGWEDLSWALKGWDSLGICPDEAQILEFLQDEKTASEFAAYLEVWQKYGKDWKLREILDGRAKTAAAASDLTGTVQDNSSIDSGSWLEETAREIRCGCFEERFTASSLLLDMLNGEIRCFMQAHSDLQSLKEKDESLLYHIKSMSRDHHLSGRNSIGMSGRNEPAAGFDLADLFETFLRTAEKSLRIRKTNHLITAEDERRERWTLKRLRDQLTSLKLMHVGTPEETERKIRGDLEERTQRERQQVSFLEEKISRGLAFAQAALGKDAPELFYLAAGLQAPEENQKFFHSCPNEKLLELSKEVQA